MPQNLILSRDGAQLSRGAYSANAVAAIKMITTPLPSNKAGIRLRGIPALKPYIGVGSQAQQLAAAFLGAAAQPVRAILFDKTPTMNWPLKWHQDRTIAVKRRIDVPGYEAWSVKAGMQHVMPPPAILAAAMTVRIHLDDTNSDNAPLLVAPGSHRLGYITEANVPQAVMKYGTFSCTAQTGDVWIYATLILHASDAAKKPSSRRVLQVDYTAASLPGGLEWLGI